MAGGIGSRFWPISRRTMPKQFLDILGTGKSFIRHTYERFAAAIPPENFLVVIADQRLLPGPRAGTHPGNRSRAGTLRTGGPQHGALHRLRGMER